MTLKLCQAFGGDTLYIPKLEGDVYKNARNNEIYRKYKQGATAKELSKEYGLAPITVSMIIVEKRKESGDDLAKKVRVIK